MHSILNNECVLTSCVPSAYSSSRLETEDRLTDQCDQWDLISRTKTRVLESSSLSSSVIAIKAKERPWSPLPLRPTTRPSRQHQNFRPLSSHHHPSSSCCRCPCPCSVHHHQCLGCCRLRAWTTMSGRTVDRSYQLIRQSGRTPSESTRERQGKQVLPVQTNGKSNSRRCCWTRGHR